MFYNSYQIMQIPGYVVILYEWNHNSYYPALKASLGLTDGSQLVMRADTAIVAAMSPEERSVTIERGGAYFDVTKDEDRPFVVSAGAVDVRAGTAVPALEKRDARPDVDGLVVLAREIGVETRQQELFDPGGLVVLGRLAGRAATVGAQRIGHQGTGSIMRPEPGYGQ